MGIKYLRRVNRFPAKNRQYVDQFALDALETTAPAEAEGVCQTAQTAWHRPSGDHALLEENLLKYDVELPKRCFDGDYLAILKETLDALRPPKKLIPLTLGASEKHPAFPLTTSPGFPWIMDGYTTKGQVINDGTGDIHRAWDQIGRGNSWSLPDALAYHRVVATPVEKTKVRPVWGFPIDVVLEEARWFLPLMDHLKRHCNEKDEFYGLGLETALSGHSHIAKEFVHEAVSLAICTDYSNFDARVPCWIIRDVFGLASDWFDFTKVQDSEGKIWDVNGERTARRWRAMVSYFINTKIRTPTGKRYQKSSGVPSGSMWTNFMDTCVNAVQTRTALRRVTGVLPFKDYYYGDDGVILLDVPSIDLDQLAKVLLDVFGAILSVDKTMLTDNAENIHWLGYYYRPGGPRRDIHFLVASAIYPEREVDTPVESCARLLGQLYSVMDPKAAVWFYDAVRYLMRNHDITQSDLDSYVKHLSPKAMKFLTTIGYSITDITLPECFKDPLGGRYIPSVIPKPCARRSTIRDRYLPEEAYIAEHHLNFYMLPEQFVNELVDRDYHIRRFDLESDFDSPSFDFDETELD